MQDYITAKERLETPASQLNQLFDALVTDCERWRKLNKIIDVGATMRAILPGLNKIYREVAHEQAP